MPLHPRLFRLAFGPSPSRCIDRNGPAPWRPRSTALLAGIALLFAALPSSAQVDRFDGNWNVVLTCPPHDEAEDDARGYTHRFPVRISNGELSGSYGTAGEPGYHHLHGTVRADGTARLRLDGIVNNPRHAIRNAQRGKEYSYRVAARFDERSGAGQRQTGRVCEFTFSR